MAKPHRSALPLRTFRSKDLLCIYYDEFATIKPQFGWVFCRKTNQYHFQPVVCEDSWFLCKQLTNPFCLIC